MNVAFESKPKSLGKESEFINSMEQDSYEEFISNSLYLRSKYQKSLEEHFESLKHLWLEETKLSSNVFYTINHPAHLQIIKLGKAVVPLLLQDLKKNHNHWFYALNLITKCNPVEKDHIGRLDAMVGDWIQWGKSENYID